jgi:hypothetical protein
MAAAIGTNSQQGFVVRRGNPAFFTFQCYHIRSNTHAVSRTNFQLSIFYAEPMPVPSEKSGFHLILCPVLRINKPKNCRVKLPR